MTADQLDIELVQDTERARWAATVLKRYHHDTDLDRLLRTRLVRIDDHLRGGHSHPVLTLGLGFADCHESMPFFAVTRTNALALGDRQP